MTIGETVSHRFHIVINETRLFEWGANLMMLAWSFILALPGETLSMSAAFAPFEATGGDRLWGGIAFLVGVVGAVALIANGHWDRSHCYRGYAAGFRAMFWTTLSLGLLMAYIRGHPASEALAIYPVLATLEFIVSKRNAQPN